MKILGLEFSSKQRSVAVLQPGKEPASLMVAEVVESGGIATKPVAMIEEAVRQAHFEREQIDLLAIGLGPGSYTGIRTAIALAQGWQLARGVKLVGISSAECIAAQALAEHIFGRVAVIIDAQRGEFYLSVYEVTTTASREVEPLRLASLVEVQARQKAGVQLIGPEITASFPEARQVFPRAAVLVELAINRCGFVPGE